MLNVTDKAVDVLADSLEASEATDQQSLRLTQNERGEYGLAIDEERDGDQVVKQEERAVLVLDADTAQALNGAVLDVVDSPEGQRLALGMAEEG